MKYEKPKMEIVVFETEDIITTSNDNDSPIVTPPVPGQEDEYNFYNNND